jgi:hypothetical protein
MIMGNHPWNFDVEGMSASAMGLVLLSQSACLTPGFIGLHDISFSAYNPWKERGELRAKASQCESGVNSDGVVGSWKPTSGGFAPAAQSLHCRELQM